MYATPRRRQRQMCIRSRVTHWQVTAASVSQVTAAAHGLETGNMVTYSVNGQTGLMNTASSAVAIGAGPFYARNIDDFTIELYDTKDHAEDTASRTGRQAFIVKTTGTYGVLVRTLRRTRIIRLISQIKNY